MNKRLPIADCRLPIGELFPRGRLSRRRHDCRKLVRFSQNCGEFSLRHRAGLDEQFEPQCRLVCFFLNRPDLGDEFSLTARSTTGAVVRSHRSSASHDLLGNSASCVVALWNCPRQFDDSQGEGFGTGFQLGWIHSAKLSSQSAIGNLQSAMAL